MSTSETPESAGLGGREPKKEIHSFIITRFVAARSLGVQVNLDSRVPKFSSSESAFSSSHPTDTRTRAPHYVVLHVVHSVLRPGLGRCFPISTFSSGWRGRDPLSHSTRVGRHAAHSSLSLSALPCPSRRRRKEREREGAYVYRVGLNAALLHRRLASLSRSLCVVSKERTNERPLKTVQAEAAVK